MNQAREKLAISRYHLGDLPHSDAAQKHWKMQEEKFQSSVIDVNQRIDNFNLIVPILNKQMVHYDSDREIKNIFWDCEKYISPNCDLSQYLPHYRGHVVTAKHETIPWKEVWKDIKGLFKSWLRALVLLGLFKSWLRALVLLGLFKSWLRALVLLRSFKSWSRALVLLGLFKSD